MSISYGEYSFTFKGGITKIKYMSGKDIYSDSPESGILFTYIHKDRYLVDLECGSFTIPKYYEFWNGTCFDFNLMVFNAFIDIGRVFKSEKGFSSISAGYNIGPTTAQKGNVLFEFGNSWRILFTKGYKSTHVLGEDVFLCFDAGAEFGAYTRYFVQIGVGITDLFNESGS